MTVIALHVYPVAFNQNQVRAVLPILWLRWCLSQGSLSQHRLVWQGITFWKYSFAEGKLSCIFENSVYGEFISCPLVLLLICLAYLYDILFSWQEFPCFNSITSVVGKKVRTFVAFANMQGTTCPWQGTACQSQGTVCPSQGTACPWQGITCS